MILILGALLAVAFAIVLAGRRARWTIDLADMGSVSEQWLAEYRAAHP